VGDDVSGALGVPLGAGVGLPDDGGALGLGVVGPGVGVGVGVGVGGVAGWLGSGRVGSCGSAGSSPITATRALTNTAS
jgi:hypothetical protein